MAIVNDPRLYSGGNAVFNANPHVALYANLLAKQSARKDAFDEYMRGLNKGINAAGVRNVDRPAFDKKLADWQQFGMQNSDAIRKRTNGADIKFMNGYQDLLNLVGESKTEEEKKKPLVDMMLDPNKVDRLNSDQVLQSIHSHDQPLYLEDGSRNHDRKSIDLSSVQFEPKPFEQDKYFKQFEDVKKSDLPPVVVKNPKDMTQMTTTTSVFDKDAKDLIATRAVSDYMNNKSFKNYVDKLNPSDYNDMFKQNFGHDIQNNGDLAAAYTLKGMQQKTVKSELKDDVFAREKAMQAIRNSDAKGLIALRHSIDKKDEEANNVWLDSYIDKVTEEGMSGTPVLYSGGKGLEHDIAIDPTLNKALEIDKQTPDRVTSTQDGKYRLIFYKYDDKGKTDEIDKNRTREISRDALKLALGGKSVSASQRPKEMLHGQGGSAAPKLRAQMPDGSIITSSDGVNWFNSKGEKAE